MQTFFLHPTTATTTEQPNNTTKTMTVDKTNWRSETKKVINGPLACALQSLLLFKNRCILTSIVVVVAAVVVVAVAAVAAVAVMKDATTIKVKQI